MSVEELQKSISEYKEQLSMIEEALRAVEDSSERDSLLTLQSDLTQLIQLTQESLDAISAKECSATKVAGAQFCEANTEREDKNELDDEYALFMAEMAKSGAYENGTDDKAEDSTASNQKENTDEDSDIEDELATLLGMKCGVYHTHKWGGQPTLHNAMVSAVEPRQNDDQFKDLQVRVLFTQPTHAEMLPCPFFLDGECRFSDEQCRFSHGAIIPLPNLKEAIVPNFESVRIGSRVLVKLKPPEGEDISLTRKSTEKYHLWHRAIVKSMDTDKRTCLLKLEHGIKTGEKRKSGTDEFAVSFEEIFPLDNEATTDTESDDSLSDTEYPESKASRSETTDDERQKLLIEKSLQTSGPAMGEWERYTRGIGSKLMLAMGYVPGTGLGAMSDGRLAPVEARSVPLGKSLDHCMALSEKAAAQDPLKVEQKLKRMQKKEEERNIRAYEREKEKERRNVFNFLNRTLGDKSEDNESPGAPCKDIKQSTNKDLNIELFKINEESRKIEQDLVKLNSSLQRQAAGSSARKNVKLQILEKNRDLDILRSKEQQLSNEQRQRKDKQKMTVF